MNTDDKLNEQLVRMECLKLAVAEAAVEPDDTVARARAYADFVLEHKSGRDA